MDFCRVGACLVQEKAVKKLIYDLDSNNSCLL